MGDVKRGLDAFIINKGLYPYNFDELVFDNIGEGIAKLDDIARGISKFAGRPYSVDEVRTDVTHSLKKLMEQGKVERVSRGLYKKTVK